MKKKSTLSAFATCFKRGASDANSLAMCQSASHEVQYKRLRVIP